MHCEDLMTATVWTCAESDSVVDCARLMATHGIGFVPVEDERGVLRGVITDRDLATRVLAPGRPSDTRVGAVMTHPVVVCGPGEELRDAEERMKEAGVSRIPVVVQGRCIGVVSLVEILRADEPPSADRLLRAVVAHGGKPPPALR
jgi:CBS domain-containing protein